MRVNRTRPGVAPEIAREVRGVANWLRTHAWVEDAVVVNIVPTALVAGENESDGPPGWACYMWPKGRGGRPEHHIFVAAGMVDLLVEEESLSRDEAVEILLENVCHEFAHYRQWVNGDEPNEEDADRFARAWVFEYLDHIGRTPVSERAESPAI